MQTLSTYESSFLSSDEYIRFPQGQAREIPKERYRALDINTKDWYLTSRLTEHAQAIGG
jgi:hypothetical protein